jgi:hypothetical protein
MPKASTALQQRRQPVEALPTLAQSAAARAHAQAVAGNRRTANKRRA